MLVKAKLPTILLLQFQSCLSKILESCLICLTPSLCAVIHSFMLCNFRSVQCSLYTIVWWPYHRTALIVQVGWKMGPEHPRANCLGGWGGNRTNWTSNCHSLLSDPFILRFLQIMRWERNVLHWNTSKMGGHCVLCYILQLTVCLLLLLRWEMARQLDQ